ncbi:hypothetical protein D3C75_424750 [compost metagenome]
MLLQMERILDLEALFTVKILQMLPECQQPWSQEQYPLISQQWHHREFHLVESRPPDLEENLVQKVSVNLRIRSISTVRELTWIRYLGSFKLKKSSFCTFPRCA